MAGSRQAKGSVKRFPAYLETHVMSQANTIAIEEGISLSALINKALRDYIRRNGPVKAPSLASVSRIQ